PPEGKAGAYGRPKPTDKKAGKTYRADAYEDSPAEYSYFVSQAGATVIGEPAAPYLNPNNQDEHVFATLETISTSEAVESQLAPLKDEVFEAIKTVWGLPLIDLFANRSKPRAERFCSANLSMQTGWLNHDGFSVLGNPAYGLLIEHCRVRATQSIARKNDVFKSTSTDDTPKPHSAFKDRTSATTAHWADIVDDLLSDEVRMYLAATDVATKVNPDGSKRTHLLWTLATIKGFWAPVILDVGASRSLILGYQDVLYDSTDLSPMDEASFLGNGGRTTSNTRVSLRVLLRGKEGEYFSFRGFFCEVAMKEDVILIANNILAPLKVQLTVQNEPLPSFATTLNNPDILIPGCISENMNTKHLLRM
ncbi:hypothetical protein BDZ88DRAFT_442967, partial [Geranomyces variabilis]